MKRVVLLVGLIGLLAACGGSSKSTTPQALPPVSGSSRPAGAPSPAVPTLSARPVTPATPSQGQPQTQSSMQVSGDVAAASAFAREWLDTINAAYAKVDYQHLQDLSDPSCQTCNNLIASLKQAATTHKHYRGGQVAVRDLAAPPLEDGRTVVVAVVSYAAAEELDVSGTVLRKQPAIAKTTLQIQLQRSPSGFRVTEMNSL